MVPSLEFLSFVALSLVCVWIKWRFTSIWSDDFQQHYQLRIKDRNSDQTHIAACTHTVRVDGILNKRPFCLLLLLLLLCYAKHHVLPWSRDPFVVLLHYTDTRTTVFIAYNATHIHGTHIHALSNNISSAAHHHSHPSITEFHLM